jgi:hypothetical protein
MRAILVILFLLAVANTAKSDEFQDALKDREKFAKSQWGYYYYFTTATEVQSERENLAKDLNFCVAIFSRDPYLPGQLPVPVTSTLYRIDTRNLLWEHSLPWVLVKYYPYNRALTYKGIAPLVIRADWFCACVVDSNITGDSQYRLLYGDHPPTTADAFTKFWGMDATASDTFGFYEGLSKVKAEESSLERIMESRPAKRAAGFGTFDSAKIVGPTDPIVNLGARPPKHDASEWLAPIIKYGKDENGKVSYGSLFAYFLSNGNNGKGTFGARQELAPVGVVKDHFNLRGYDIKQTFDCISCHDTGLQRPSFDKYRDVLVGGVVVKTIYDQDKKLALAIERYYQSPFGRDIERGIEDYALAVKMCNGLSPQENSQNFRERIRRYDADVSPQQAARELYTSVGELRLAIGHYNNLYPTKGIDGRTAMLGEGQTISRDQFEYGFYQLQLAMAAWQQY